MRYYYVIRNLCTTRFRSHSATTFTAHSSSFSSSSSSTLSKFDGDSILASLKLNRNSDSDELSDDVFKQVSSIFYGDQSVKTPIYEEIDGANEFERILSMLQVPNAPQSNISVRRKELSREKKRKCIFKITQENRFRRLIESCAKILGTEETVELFDKMGQKPGVKGYNAMVELCIGKARGAENEDIATEEIGKVFQLLELMRKQGLEVEERTYRPLLLYLIDMGLVEEFEFFCHVIKDENPSSIARLGYYEMTLWLRVNNEEKIQGLCNYIAENDGEDTFDLRESYLLALCESERRENILEALENIDIQKISSVDSVAKIFQALGRLLVEPVAEKLLLDFKTNHEADNITNFIANYAVSIPDLSVEDGIKKFKDLHQKLEVLPSSSSYEKLILHNCALLKYTCSDGELDQLLLLLEELNDTVYWNDACCRIILCCIWNKHLSSAIDLCKLLKDKLQDDELVMKVLFDKVFSLIEESESNHLHTCMVLLSEIKDKHGLLPSQKCYDSLLVACENANNNSHAE
ncbi:pentatricopeptide repeat-containing protein At4g04790, mitochondrial-like isoform X2 [Cicer arietinum]|uniref:Pentatricopeptide repeat-containing protein At4g04790, mitochondrial-like isoform X2 n=1 Tax=Cicer arietinum TaxID=3827 RepID=A0A1S2XDF5_CICAR|nr:pentatricopeptide repeat-containing protein At4g04790, mitochondrial-like isoform X2 [Cicer arietinum]